MQNTSKRVSTRKITVTAMLSAVAAVLMLIEVSVPFMPEFIKLDISELPALLAAFGLGPVCGAAVCLISKRLVINRSLLNKSQNPYVGKNQK